MNASRSKSEKVFRMAVSRRLMEHGLEGRIAAKKPFLRSGNASDFPGSKNTGLLMPGRRYSGWTRLSLNSQSVKAGEMGFHCSVGKLVKFDSIMNKNV